MHANNVNINYMCNDIASHYTRVLIDYNMQILENMGIETSYLIADDEKIIILGYTTNVTDKNIKQLLKTINDLFKEYTNI